VGGILVQAWFCFYSSIGPREELALTVRKSTLLTEAGAGVLYAASIILLSGGCYQG